jgi:hypothetical protein
MILPDDETLASDNYAAYEAIQCHGPNAETTHKVLSAIIDDHLIIRVEMRMRHQWILTLTAMEHVDNRIVAIAVWQRQFGPFIRASLAWEFAEKYLRKLCMQEGIPFREVRCEN